MYIGCNGVLFDLQIQLVKSGKFGHHVNSDTHLQTVIIQMRWLLRSFTVCLGNFFLQYLNMKQTRSPSEFSRLSELTLIYHYTDKHIRFWYLGTLCISTKMHLIIFMLDIFPCFCCRLRTFSFKKKLPGTLSECQTVWIQSGSNLLAYDTSHRYQSCWQSSDVHLREYIPSLYT